MKTSSSNTSNSAIAVGVLFLLADGTIQSCNTIAESILGYTAKQFIGTCLFELPWQTRRDVSFSSENHPAAISLKTGQSCSETILGFERSTSGLIWLSIDTEPLFKIDRSQPYGVEVTFVDVTRNISQDIAPPAMTNNEDSEPVTSLAQDLTNNRESSIALWESEQRLKLATDAAGIGMWFWDLVDDSLKWTRQGKIIFGLPLDRELSLEACFDVIHPDDRDFVESAIDESLTNKTEYSVEYRVIWSDNSVHWIFAKGKGFYDRDDRPLQMVGTVQDISDRKATEAILKQREHELELITEVIPQQVWTALPSGEVDYVNRRWQEYAGTTLAEIKGRSWSRVVHPDDLEWVERAWNHSITTGKKYNIEARIRRADGKYCWFIGRARPLRNKRGEIIKWYGTNTSITRIKELESQLIQQAEDLANANRLKDEFLAIVSHELRTPLNPILGWAQMLTSGRLNAEKTAMGISIIERNAKLQAQLIEDLLDVSRILQGKLNLQKTPLSLESIIKSALTTVSLAAEAKSIEIATIYEPNIGRVIGDASRLQQIVWNLISNAIKFTTEGGQITIELERVGSQAQIEIRDTGQGIDPEFLPYVFDRFRQAESNSTRQYGGLGLGLAIVRHLCELHGGTVSVSSPGKDRGATFTIGLPLEKTLKPEVTEIDNTSGEVKVRDNRCRGTKILVVDDNVDSLNMLSLILEPEGIEIKSATSAQEALEAYKKEIPDLIISDIGMPDVSGYTFIAQIRQLPQGKDIPAIALTAYAGEADRQRSTEAGFQKHISKPIDISELVITIKELIKGIGIGE